MHSIKIPIYPALITATLKRKFLILGKAAITPVAQRIITMRENKFSERRYSAVPSIKDAPEKPNISFKYERAEERLSLEKNNYNHSYGIFNKYG